MLTLLLAQCKMALPSFCQRTLVYHIATAIVMLALASAELSGDVFEKDGGYTGFIAGLPALIYTNFVFIIPCNPHPCVFIATVVWNLATVASICAAIIMQKTCGVEQSILRAVIFPIHLFVLVMHFIVILGDKVVPLIRTRFSDVSDVTYSDDGTNI